MKKLIALAFAFALTVSLLAIAQDTTRQPDMQQPTSTTDNTSTAVSLSGTVGEDGKTFVSDTDNKSWTVTNPKALKGHEGKQVIVKAQVDKAKNEIRVTSVKKGKGKKQETGKEPMSEQMPK
jgi:lipopolysaccharide export LptBFGC system permease protein LptF